MTATEHFPFGIAVMDSAGRLTHANQRIREWFQLLPVDERGRNVDETCLVCGEQCRRLCGELRQLAAQNGGRPARRRVQLDDGRQLECRCDPLPGSGGPEGGGCLLVVEDVTALREIERRLRDTNAELVKALAERASELTYNREFLRSLIETNRDLILSVDGDGIITFTNGGFVGARAGVLVGKTLDALVAEPYRALLAERYRHVLDGRLSHTLFEAQGAEALQGHWCLLSIGPLRGDQISGLTVIVSDLTELKDAWERVRGAEKLVATGRMAARIAHEINNPLTGISGAIQLIKADLDAETPTYRYAEMVEREITRVSNIVRQMYGLYRPEREVSRVIDLQPVLAEVVTLMTPDAERARVQLRLLVQGGEPALVQEQNLRQVLMNVVRNAIEVTTPGGAVELSVERHGRCVDVVVADDGPGISEEMQQQMFEPFFTTKSSSGGRGLGLGLSVSDTLAKAMGGSIEFENRPGGGARCRICLPEAGL